MVSKLVILISGNGSNLRAIIDAIALGTLPKAIISLVISNRKDAYGLQRARNAEIETAYKNLVSYGKRYPSIDSNIKYSPAAREAYDADLADKILSVNPDMVVLAGWMHVRANLSRQIRRLSCAQNATDDSNLQVIDLVQCIS